MPVLYNNLIVGFGLWKIIGFCYSFLSVGYQSISLSAIGWIYYQFKIFENLKPSTNDSPVIGKFKIPQLYPKQCSIQFDHRKKFENWLKHYNQ